MRFVICHLVVVLGLALPPWNAGAQAPLASGSDVEQALGAVPPRYTHHRSRPARTEIIPLRLQGAFSPRERARITYAVGSWNRVLNRFVRFDLVVDDNDADGRAWLIVPARQPSARSGLDFALALTQPVPSGGGVIILYANRLGGRDLGAVLLHELGHVLGLGHDGGDGLMSAYYSAQAQSCVDRGTAARIAAGRHLPLEQLNWCEAGPVEH